MENQHNGVPHACVKKQGRYLWTDREWIPRHDAEWKKKKQCKRLPTVCSPSCEKQGDMRKRTCICSAVQKKSRKDKLESKMTLGDEWKWSGKNGGREQCSRDEWEVTSSWVYIFV